MDIKEVEWYTQKIIPNIEKRLTDKTLSTKEKLELYNAYVDTMKIVAPHDFITFNKYLELDDDHSNPNKAFYHHRKDHIGDIFQAMNDMEIYDKYDMVLISLAPRVGKSQTNIRFIAWIIGRKPWGTQLATSYSDAITSSFYAGVMEIVLSERYQEVFPESPLVNQNAKKQEIWLGELKRYPSVSFVSIGGSMTGRSEASQYLFADDLVSGIEEAMSVTRLDKLWQLYTVNAKQRKKDGAKEVHIATRWSVHDPITKLARENADNPRCKIINVPCYDEEGESQFNFKGGFSTNYYKELEKSMDKISFGALYMCNPIEREGLLYHEEDMQYYFELPENPDAIISVVDSKNMGKDYVSAPVGYVYGDMIYLDDVVYNNGLPEVTIELVANKMVEHRVVRCDIEMNNGGNYYAENVNEKIQSKGGKTSVRTFFTSSNKDTKIITYSDYVKKHFVFRDKSTYSKNSDYAKFMEHVFAWTQMGKNKFDDAPDTLAMLAQLGQELSGNSMKIIKRQELGI